ncbi:MAG: iron ABC transporter permease [Crenarchaeota archaeon]|nr:iron ABC transporter permease [Thermoproteota archaeon]
MSTAAELKSLYKKGRKRKVIVIASILLALVVSIIISVSFGAGSPRFNEAMSVIFSKIFPSLGIDAGSKLTQTIILDLRLPRIVLAMLAGAGLAAAGATMQGVLRNPLVSSYTLGISSAAGFGASLAIIFGIGVINSFGGYLIIVNAFCFSMLAMLLVYGIARLRGMTTSTMILAGVAISYLFSALSSLIQYIAPEHTAVAQVVFWLMGGLSSATWQNIIFILPIVVVTIVLMIQQSWNINVLSMGESIATSLGVNSKRVMAFAMILSTLVTAAIISFTGVIGFVCLVSPHLARMLIGGDHRFLIPCSVVVGACLLLCSDTVARLILAPAELPVGIVTSLLGVPFFIYMLISRRRQGWD